MSPQGLIQLPIFQFETMPRTDRIVLNLFSGLNVGGRARCVPSRTLWAQNPIPEAIGKNGGASRPDLKSCSFLIVIS